MADWYAVYETGSGRLVSTGTVVADPLRGGLAKKKLAFNPQKRRDKAWNTERRDYDDVIPPRPKLTRQEFFDRFTSEEMENILEAATRDKRVRLLVEKFKMADEIRTDSSEVITAVSVLEAVGLIRAGRAAEVLDG